MKVGQAPLVVQRHEHSLEVLFAAGVVLLEGVLDLGRVVLVPHAQRAPRPRPRATCGCSVAGAQTMVFNVGGVFLWRGLNGLGGQDLVVVAAAGKCCGMQPTRRNAMKPTQGSNPRKAYLQPRARPRRPRPQRRLGLRQVPPHLLGLAPQQPRAVPAPLPTIRVGFTQTFSALKPSLSRHISNERHNTQPPK